MKVLLSRLPGALMLISLLLLAHPAKAERVDPFFVAVEVPDRSAAARRRALRQALGKVLVALSGQALLVADLQHQSRLPFRDPLVQQFHYQEARAAADAEETLELEVHFSAPLVLALAADLGLPVWPLERGVTIMWVALDSGIHRELLGASADHQALNEAATRAAQARKLPLVMPLLDLEDRRQVSFSDVWGGFSDQVWAASTRYATQYLLLGRVYRTTAGWGGQWQIRDGQRVERWSAEAVEEASVLAAAVEHAAESLGRRYAKLSTAGADQVLVIRLEGVNGVRDYVRVLRYLGGLSVIQSVAPLRITPDTLDVSVESKAGIEAIENALAIEPVLALVDSGAPPEAGIMLHYRLNP